MSALEEQLAEAKRDVRKAEVAYEIYGNFFTDAPCKYQEDFRLKIVEVLRLTREVSQCQL